MKHALITGVSTGIGRELSRQMIAAGYHVFGSVRHETVGNQLKSELGSEFTPLIFDVTDATAIFEAYQVVHNKTSEHGLDVLVNNAGIAVGGPLLHVPIEEIRYQFEVNVIGLLQVTQVFAPLLRVSGKKPAGRILMVSSVAGKIGMPFIGPYVGSKHALEGISKSLRRELQLDGIKVIVIGPGAIKTPIWEKSLESVKDNYTQTPYGVAIGIFGGKFVTKAAASGLDPVKFCGEVVKIVKIKNPKNRYVMVSRWLMSWAVPYYLPEKWLDYILKKLLKLSPKQP